MTITYTLSELAQTIGAELHGPLTSHSLVIEGVATLEQATAAHLSFLTNPRFAAKVKETNAAAVIVASPIPDFEKPQLVSRNPYAAMAKASQCFFRRQHTFSGQSELAFVHSTAKIAASATIYPFAYIDQGAVIGPDSIVYPHCYVGINAVLGARCLLFPSAVVMEECQLADDVVVHAGAVIGADGFGYAPTREGIEKIPQIGGVIIGAGCEIGSATSVNRGAFENTVLGQGVKLDSHVHVGHGVQIGDFSMLCGLTGIAGSAKLGKRFIGGGQSAVAPGIEVGDHVSLGGKSGLISSTENKGEYIGFPAAPAPEWRRQTVALSKLPELLKTVRQLEQRLAQLENKSSD